MPTVSNVKLPCLRVRVSQYQLLGVFYNLHCMFEKAQGSILADEPGFGKVSNYGFSPLIVISALILWTYRQC